MRPSPQAASARRHRRLLPAALVAIALVSAACSATPDADPAGAVSPAPDAPHEPSPEPTAAEPTPIPADATAVVSPTGVPVAVVARTPDAVIVRTPCGNDATLSHGEAIQPVTVVLDPGHGGPVDTGTIGPNGLHESTLNLHLAAATEDVLESRGISAALTRTADYAMPLSVRAEFATAAGADLLVSIHHNAPASAPSARPGTEVFVQSPSLHSHRLGRVLYEEVVAALSTFDIAWTSRRDAGVLRVVDPAGNDVYGMIRRPHMPAVLLELGYLANPAEAELFATEAYVDTAAAAIADGIEAYLTSDRTGSGWVDEARTFKPRGSQAAQDCVDPALS